MVGEPEDRRTVGASPNRGLVAADALEHRGAVMQYMRHHMRGGLGPGLDRAVVPDPFGILHRIVHRKKATIVPCSRALAQSGTSGGQCAGA